MEMFIWCVIIYSTVCTLVLLFLKGAKSDDDEQ